MRARFQGEGHNLQSIVRAHFPRTGTSLTPYRCPIPAEGIDPSRDIGVRFQRKGSVNHASIRIPLPRVLAPYGCASPDATSGSASGEPASAHALSIVHVLASDSKDSPQPCGVLPQACHCAANVKSVEYASPLSKVIVA